MRLKNVPVECERALASLLVSPAEGGEIGEATFC